MKQITVLIITMLTCGLVYSTDPPSALVTDGISLHDAGNFEAAIATFKKALQEDPDDPVAIYELANTYATVGDFEQCLAFAERGLKLETDIEPMLFSVAGSCLSADGDTKKALKTFNRGLKKHPDDISLNFNIAITLAKSGDLSESKEHLKHVIKQDPAHRSSHYILSKVLLSEGNRVPAILCSLRFLTLEIGTKRSQETAATLVNLLHSGVTQEGEKEVSISLSTGGPVDEGDFSAVELFLALSAATSLTEEERDKTPAQHLAKAVTDLLSLLEESKDDDLKSTFVWQSTVDPLLQMKAEGHLEAYLAILASEADLEGTSLLPGASEEKVNNLVEWLRSLM